MPTLSHGESLITSEAVDVLPGEIAISCPLVWAPQCTSRLLGISQIHPLAREQDRCHPVRLRTPDEEQILQGNHYSGSASPDCGCRRKMTNGGTYPPTAWVVVFMVLLL